MPRIPLYNQGQGPAVQLATGPLSRRADVGAFTAPGQALASFGEKASQIAFQFGEAEKKAETERVYTEQLSQVSESFDEFKRSQPARTVSGFNISAGEFKTNALSSIDGRDDLTKSQKQQIKNSLSKSLDIKIASARNDIWNGQQLQRKTDFIRSIDAMKIDAADPLVRENVLSNMSYLIDFANENGFSTGLNIADIRYDLEKSDHLADRENQNLSIGYFQEELSKVNKGEGKYKGYSSSQQRETAGLIQSHINYMETGIKAQAQQDLKTAENNIMMTGSAGEAGAAAIKGFQSIGLDVEAENAAMAIEVGQDVYASLSSVSFSSPKEIENFMSMQTDIANELVAKGESTRAVTYLKALNAGLVEREKQIASDPVDYVFRTYKRLYDREPTRSQVIQAQHDLGIDDSKIKVLTGNEVNAISAQIQNAETTRDVEQAILSVTGEANLAPYAMRQLRAGGVSLSANYIANGPTLPSSQLLLDATRPDAVKISITPASKDKIRAAIMTNPEVRAHLNSMLGGTYYDFNNNNILGSVSNTVSMSRARDEHIEMLSTVTAYLIQKDGKTLSGTEGFAVSESEIEGYAAQAATILTDRYDYIETFPNTSVSLRIPAGVAGRKSTIKANLNEAVSSLTVSDIFYQDNVYAKGTPEYEMSNKEYVDRVKDEYSWLAANDGGNFYLVDGFGGLVLGKDGEPISMTLTEAIAQKARPETDVVGEDLNETAFGLQAP